MDEKINVSLELLLLNDLLTTKVIDKNIYDLATQKIVTIETTAQLDNSETRAIA